MSLQELEFPIGARAMPLPGGISGPYEARFEEMWLYGLLEFVSKEVFSGSSGRRKQLLCRCWGRTGFMASVLVFVVEMMSV
jgi:hypothetical protein